MDTGRQTILNQIAALETDFFSFRWDAVLKTWKENELLPRTSVLYIIGGKSKLSEAMARLTSYEVCMKLEILPETHHLGR